MKLHERGVYIEPKPFSIGLRIEHPQSLIDTCRFGKHAGDPLLGAAITSWCITVAMAARCTASACVLRHGGGGRLGTGPPGHQWHESIFAQRTQCQQRIVVGITPEDYPDGPLAGIAFQRQWEERAFELGGGNYQAPGQLVGDFLAGALRQNWDRSHHPTHLACICAISAPHCRTTRSRPFARHCPPSTKRSKALPSRCGVDRRRDRTSSPIASNAMTIFRV